MPYVAPPPQLLRTGSVWSYYGAVYHPKRGNCAAQMQERGRRVRTYVWFRRPQSEADCTWRSRHLLPTPYLAKSVGGAIFPPLKLRRVPCVSCPATRSSSTFSPQSLPSV